MPSIWSILSAPYLFNLVDTALEWILKEQSTSPYVIHYLDDFLFAEPANNSCCKHTLEMSKSVCSHLGIKIKTEKCVGPTTRITFLGIEIDTLSQTMRAQRKIKRATNRNQCTQQM